MARKTGAKSTSSGVVSNAAINCAAPADIDQEHASAEKPVSLKPLKFEDAVRGLLQARPKKGKKTGDTQEANSESAGENQKRGR